MPLMRSSSGEVRELFVCWEVAPSVANMTQHFCVDPPYNVGVVHDSITPRSHMEADSVQPSPSKIHFGEHVSAVQKALHHT